MEHDAGILNELANLHVRMFIFAPGQILSIQEQTFFF